uniref:Homeobox domain-containing protein n=1 Tax=Spongospora subterranea TaxID=70186 RepID=A0A0H5RPC2_9EUKA|eukprot:CRZ10569.1 hypothetical protein [Spongospora subterranea]
MEKFVDQDICTLRMACEQAQFHRTLPESPESLSKTSVKDRDDLEVSSPIMDEDTQEDVPNFKSRASTKRKRHNLSPNQSRILEKAFSLNPHPGRKLRLEISNMITLDVDKVRKWFENRRNKAKRVEAMAKNTFTSRQKRAESSPGDEDIELPESWRNGAREDGTGKDETQPAIMSLMKVYRDRIDAIESNQFLESEPTDEENLDFRQNPILEASSISGDRLGEMVAPFVSEFIFHIGSQIRERFGSDDNAGQIIQAQETFRIHAERLFACVRYDCRTILLKTRTSCEASCFAFFISAGDATGNGKPSTSEFEEVRIDCVMELVTNSLTRIVFHIHTQQEESFAIGCKRVSNGAVAWGDVRRLKALLHAPVQDRDLWSLLIFLGVCRPAISETWLATLISQM